MSRSGFPGSRTAGGFDADLDRGQLGTKHLTATDSIEQKGVTGDSTSQDRMRIDGGRRFDSGHVHSSCADPH